MNVTDIKPSQLRRYLYEYVLIGLVLAVGYLFIRTEKLNSYIRNDLTTQKIEAQAVIMNNNKDIEELLKKYPK